MPSKHINIDVRINNAEEFLRIVATQTAANTKKFDEIADLMKKGQDEHNREMKELRMLMKQLIKKVLV